MWCLKCEPSFKSTFALQVFEFNFLGKPLINNMRYSWCGRGWMAFFVCSGYHKNYHLSYRNSRHSSIRMTPMIPTETRVPSSQWKEGRSLWIFSILKGQDLFSLLSIIKTSQSINLYYIFQSALYVQLLFSSALFQITWSLQYRQWWRSIKVTWMEIFLLS